MLNNTVNRVTLIAIVEKAPEIRTFASGDPVCNLFVKTSEKWEDRRTGEEREISQFNRVGIYVKPFIKLIEDEVHKGDLVYIEGRMETRKTVDQSGEEKFWTEVSVRPYHGSFAKLSSDVVQSSSSSHSGSGSNSNKEKIQNDTNNNTQDNVGAGDDDGDDEIPF